MDASQNNNKKEIETTFVTTFENSRIQAEKIANDPDMLEKLLENMEEKLNQVPALGGVLANIPVLVSMVRSYINKEYTQLPVGTLIGIVAALLYFISPVDAVPDVIPGIGYIDDAAVIAITLAFIGADVATYKQWREQQKK